MQLERRTNRVPPTSDQLRIVGADESKGRQAPTWAVLALLCAAQFMVVLDFSIVNVALPSIQRSFEASQAWLQGLVSAYALTFGGFLLLGGRAADLFGRSRMFVTGLVLFALASLLGGVAPHPGLLVAARALQGIGAAVLSPAALSLVTSMFRDGRERYRALGIYGALGAGGFAIGVSLGGLLTEGPGWRWVFFVNVPIGLIAALLSRRLLLNAPRSARTRELDVPGALTGTLGLGLLVLGLTEAPGWGWTSVATLGCIAVALASLAFFVAIESRARAPLLPPRFFRNRSAAVADAVALLTTASIAPQVFVLSLSLYLQTVEGYSAIQTGLIFLVQGATAIVGGVLGSRGVSALGTRWMLAGGRAAAAAALILLVPLPVHEVSLTLLLPALALLGFANVCTFVASSVAATSGVDSRELGLASGLLYTAQQVGAAVGISALIALAATRTAFLQQTGADPTSAIVDGFRVALVGCALISILAAVVALADSGRGRRADSSSTSERDQAGSAARELDT